MSLVALPPEMSVDPVAGQTAEFVRLDGGVWEPAQFTCEDNFVGYRLLNEVSEQRIPLRCIIGVTEVGTSGSTTVTLELDLLDGPTVGAQLAPPTVDTLIRALAASATAERAGLDRSRGWPDSAADAAAFAALPSGAAGPPRGRTSWITVLIGLVVVGAAAAVWLVLSRSTSAGPSAAVLRGPGRVETTLTALSFMVVIGFVMAVGPWRPSFGVERKMALRELLGGSWRRAAAVAASAGALAAALLVGIAVEHEVRTGNGRLVASSGADYFIVQEGARDWINSSFVPSEVLSDLTSRGIRAWGTERFFASDSGDDLFVVSYSAPESIFAPRIVTGRLAEDGDEVVADSGLGRGIGDRVTIGGQRFTVVGLTTGTSSLGKQSVFIPESSSRRITGSDTYTVLGLQISGGAVPQPVPGTEQLSMEEFLAGNEGFWQRNGTLIVTSLLAAIVVLSILGTAAAKRAELALHRRDNATMLAVGARRRTVVAKELVKAGVRGVIGIPVGLVMGVAVLWLLNSKVVGLSARIEARFVIWVLALMLLIPAAAVTAAMWQFRKVSLVGLLADR